MALVFTPTNQTPEGGNVFKAGGVLLLVGTITFSGSYATGGDTFTGGKNPEALLKQIGAGRVLAVLTSARGNALEWDPVADKLKVYASANTEAAAAAYNAALTASPVSVVIIGR